MNTHIHWESTCEVREVLVQGAVAPLRANLYHADLDQISKVTLVVFFHGGRFVADELDDAHTFLCALAAHNPSLIILAPRYRLAAEQPFPAALEDAYSTLAWAQKNKAGIGWSGKRLVVFGIGAGGNLATVSNLVSHDRRGPVIAAQVLVAPMLDASLSSTSMRRCTTDACETAYRAYLPRPSDRMHPYASPLHSSRLKNLAPALVVSQDGHALRDEAEQYGAKLTAHGVKTQITRLVTTPGFDHPVRDGASLLFDALPSVNEFLARI